MAAFEQLINTGDCFTRVSLIQVESNHGPWQGTRLFLLLKNFP